MNWTGGRLQRHSKANANAQIRTQKQYFNRVRLQSKSKPHSPSLSSFSILKHLQHDTPGSGTQEGSRLLQHDVRRELLLESPDRTPYRTRTGLHCTELVPNDSRTDKPSYKKAKLYETSSNLSFAHSYQGKSQIRKHAFNYTNRASSKLPRNDTMASIKYELLQRTDWTGLSATKPVQIKFAAAEETKMIGRRRKIIRGQRNGANFSTKLSENHSRRRQFPIDKYPEDISNGEEEDLSIRIGSNIHRTHESEDRMRKRMRPPTIKSISTESMLLDNYNPVNLPNRRLYRSDNYSHLVVDSSPDKQENPADYLTTLVPLNEALDLESFDQVLQRSLGSSRRGSFGSVTREAIFSAEEHSTTEADAHAFEPFCIEPTRPTSIYERVYKLKPEQIPQVVGSISGNSSIYRDDPVLPNERSVAGQKTKRSGHARNYQTSSRQSTNGKSQGAFKSALQQLSMPDCLRHKGIVPHRTRANNTTSTMSGYTRLLDDSSNSELLHSDVGSENMTETDELRTIGSNKTGLRKLIGGVSQSLISSLAPEGLDQTNELHPVTQRPQSACSTSKRVQVGHNVSTSQHDDRRSLNPHILTEPGTVLITPFRQENFDNAKNSFVFAHSDYTLPASHTSFDKSHYTGLDLQTLNASNRKQRAHSNQSPGSADTRRTGLTSVNTTIFTPTRPNQTLLHSQHSITTTDFLTQFSPMEGRLDERLRDISVYNNAAKTEKSFISLLEPGPASILDDEELAFDKIEHHKLKRNAEPFLSNEESQFQLNRPRLPLQKRISRPRNRQHIWEFKNYRDACI